MKRRTGAFTARGDDNRSYTIYEYTNFIDVSSHDNPSAEISRLRELWTSEGLPVNWMQTGIYKIVTTGVILRSDESIAT